MSNDGIGLVNLDLNHVTQKDVLKNVAFLQQLLVESIAYLDGDDAARLMESAKQAALIDAKAGPTHLDFLFSALSAKEAVFLARAFTCQSMLINIGEDVAGRRREAEVEAAGDRNHPRTLVAALDWLKLGGEAAQSALSPLLAMPVLTAHPTEVRRRAVVDREQEISKLMALRRHHLPPSLDRRIREDLFREIGLLWRTRLNRPDRITVQDEIRNTVAIVREALLPALVELYQRWPAEHPDLLRMSPILKLGSWIGGDRDGHPGVDGKTLKFAMAAQSKVIFEHYIAEVRHLWSDFALSSQFSTASEALMTLAVEGGDASPHRKDEPYRLALENILRRLAQTSARLSAEQPLTREHDPKSDYANPQEFLSDLRVIEASLVESSGERLVGHRLRNLMLVVQACGFHLMSIDLRQNADVHERVIAELLTKAGWKDNYLDLDEEQRFAVLERELSHPRLLKSPYTDYSDETSHELAILEAAHGILDEYGIDALGSYVISKTDSASDVLEALVLLKQVGIVRIGATPVSDLRVAPLLETIDDLNRGPIILDRLFASPTYVQFLTADRIQEVVVGYSDSNKDGGYVASRRSVGAASGRLVSTCEAHGYGLRLLHGRGGSVGRGGGPASEAVMAQPAGSVRHGIRMTEQGEMVARRYGDQPTARRNLDALTTSTLLASRRTAASDDTPAAVSQDLDILAQASFAAYQTLVYKDPDFEDFFWSATPVSEIASLNIGSRPASRKSSRKIEDLRAIPWVFSWSQARFMLPGWFGLATAVETAGFSLSRLRELIEADGIFAALVSNMELALAQSDMSLAARYSALAPARDAAERIFSAIRSEHSATHRLLLDLRHGDSLLDNRPDLAASVALAAESVSPLNNLQLELLQRLRRGQDEPDLHLGIHLTVAGIAAGLRNTG
jgi:phosphoenolpyruvate carboxylase